MSGIFSEDNKVVGGAIWKPKKFGKKATGDRIEGTLVGIREVESQLSNRMQKVYEIKVSGDVVTDGKKQDVPKGDVWVVFGTPYLERNMAHIQLGQIIGISYEEDKKLNRPGMSPMKVIDAFAPPGAVDKEWLESKDENDTNVGKTNDEKFIEEMSDDGIELEITSIAKEKLGATEDIEDVKMKVMEATRKAFIPQNLASILEDLKKL